MHSHSDVTLLDDPGGESKVFQGVTTEVTGNCGFSPFPIGPSGPEGAGDPDMASVHPWNWKDLDGWADALESSGISINVAPQVGHSSVRSAVGLREDRRPTPDELDDDAKAGGRVHRAGRLQLLDGTDRRAVHVRRH